MTDAPTQQERFTDCTGHALVLGGPGSGKTTSALIKVAREIGDNCLVPEQKVLFLSFARATVARVSERARELLPSDAMKNVEINTYHGFIWRLLKSHGYLLNGKRSIRLLTPPDCAALMSGVPKGEQSKEKERLFQEEGRVDFGQFAPLAGQLLDSSSKLRRIVSNAYPIIVLDEFQDTDEYEWNLIRILGEHSRLIALADPEQRIYEFRGADPARIQEYIAAFKPVIIDYGDANYRSNGTDIAVYGNDLLTGAHRKKQYSNVAVVAYGFRKGDGWHSVVKSHVLGARERLRRDNDSTDWSLAVLVPTKRLMMEVSDCLSQVQVFKTGRSLPEVQHEVAVDADGPTLAATVISALLDRRNTVEEAKVLLLKNVVAHLRGRRGAQGPNKQQLGLGEAIDKYLETGSIRGSKRKQLVDEANVVASRVDAISFCGDPGQDWLTVRKFLSESAAEQLVLVADDAKYLRLLNKGGQLRNRLSELWRSTEDYYGATEVVQSALVQEHFAASTRSWNGVTVMTVHKSKGKEFDEVILYEGAFQGRFVRDDATDKQAAQALLTLRVGVTRAKQRATILTPQRAPSRLL